MLWFYSPIFFYLLPIYKLGHFITGSVNLEFSKYQRNQFLYTKLKSLICQKIKQHSYITEIIKNPLS